ncbi:MAG: shikimate dehydrogenase [Candidatus Omnitrophica bacterium]|nr:shikimate dehydrogenase [Candidatus Omnitrophota bacterium]
MTRLFGIIGHPIAHSLSPAMHEAALRALRLDARYAAVEVPPRFLRPALRALILAGVEGLNVTVPLKEPALRLMDRLDGSARAAGAVNTIAIRDRHTVGYNTDGIGFARAVSELGWRPRQGAQAVVLGAGGAARAVAWELARRGTGCVAIANRHPARAKRLAAWLSRRRLPSCVCAVPLGEVDVGAADLVVNATTVGMRAGDRPLIDPRALCRGAIVYDLVYHRETALVRGARRRGCVAAGGLSMLLYQGAESLRIWLKRPPPVEAMRRALMRAITAHE